MEKNSLKIANEIIENASKKSEDRNKKTTVQMLDNLSNGICIGADLVLYIIMFYSFYKFSDGLCKEYAF